jgi:hypothetical protein
VDVARNVRGSIVRSIRSSPLFAPEEHNKVWAMAHQGLRRWQIRGIFDTERQGRL